MKIEIYFPGVNGSATEELKKDLKELKQHIDMKLSELGQFVSTIQSTVAPLGGQVQQINSTLAGIPGALDKIRGEIVKLQETVGSDPEIDQETKDRLDSIATGILEVSSTISGLGTNTQALEQGVKALDELNPDIDNPIPSASIPGGARTVR
jgi:chromosome segregation ATPase